MSTSSHGLSASSQSDMSAASRPEGNSGIRAGLGIGLGVGLPVAAAILAVPLWLYLRKIKPMKGDPNVPSHLVDTAVLPPQLEGQQPQRM